MFRFESRDFDREVWEAHNALIEFLDRQPKRIEAMVGLCKLAISVVANLAKEDPDILIQYNQFVNAILKVGDESNA